MEEDRILTIVDSKELRVGDKLLFNKVGSYTMTLSPLFIEYFPSVYVKKGLGEYVCVRTRWDIDEYMQKSILYKS